LQRERKKGTSGPCRSQLKTVRGDIKKGVAAYPEKGKQERYRIKNNLPPSHDGEMPKKGGGGKGLRIAMKRGAASYQLVRKEAKRA